MRVIPILATLALAVYSAAVTASGLDRMSARDEVLERVVPWPMRAEAHRAAAELDLGRGRQAEAVRDAQAAVWYDPIHPDSTALLGEAYLRSENFEAADRAFRVAALFGWRNAATQFYWYGAALDAGDYKVAMDRAEAILRLRVSRVSAQTLLDPLEATPEGRRLIAERLHAGPPWANAYLNLADLEPGDARFDRRIQVLLDRPAGPTGLECAHVADLVKTLLGKQRRPQAIEVWNRYCPQERASQGYSDPALARVQADGGANPFGWKVVSSGDLMVQTPQEGSGIALRSTASVTRPALRQSLSSRSGEVLVTIRGENLAAVEPQLECARETGRSMVQAGGEETLSARFQVRDCEFQRLTVSLRPGSESVLIRRIELGQGR